MAEEKYRLVPLDKSGLVYLGVNVTNGNEAALLVMDDDDDYDIIGFTWGDNRGDYLFWETLLNFIRESSAGDDGKVKLDVVEIDDHEFYVQHWTNPFDNAVALLIDRLIDMRMKNASAVTLKFQLEMPLP